MSQLIGKRVESGLPTLVMPGGDEHVAGERLPRRYGDLQGRYRFVLAEQQLDLRSVNAIAYLGTK
ncbi:MAG: hypothetical protein WAT74_08200 [Flavobacteriales bacterium]